MTIYRHFITVLILAVGFSACTQSGADAPSSDSPVQIDTKLKYEDGLYYPLEGDEPFTGRVEWTYNEGGVAARITYQQGRLVTRKGYYRNGQMLNALTLDADTLVSSVTWYPSGQMKTKYERGDVKQWYESGQLRAVWKTDSAGILQGKATAWYPDGTLMGIEHYQDGKLDGERMMYDSTGTLTDRGHFRKGQRVGVDNDSSES